MPQMQDPNFVKSVVLVCEHTAEGAFGLVVNRPSELTAAEAVEMQPELDAPNALPLLIGGPVEPLGKNCLKTLKPSAVNPPSAKRNAWMISTTTRAKVAAYGPTNTIASAAPIK